jgi:hypothetical protein
MGKSEKDKGWMSPQRGVRKRLAVLGDEVKDVASWLFVGAFETYPAAPTAAKTASPATTERKVFLLIMVLAPG